MFMSGFCTTVHSFFFLYTLIYVYLRRHKLRRLMYLTIRIRARNFYLCLRHSIDWRQKLRASILIVLAEISEEETKEQRHFFDKQLLNLVIQTINTDYKLETVRRASETIKLILQTHFFVPLKIFISYFFFFFFLIFFF